MSLFVFLFGKFTVRIQDPGSEERFGSGSGRSGPRVSMAFHCQAGSVKEHTLEPLQGSPSLSASVALLQSSSIQYKSKDGLDIRDSVARLTGS